MVTYPYLEVRTTKGPVSNSAQNKNSMSVLQCQFCPGLGCCAFTDSIFRFDLISVVYSPIISWLLYTFHVQCMWQICTIMITQTYIFTMHGCRIYTSTYIFWSYCCEAGSTTCSSVMYLCSSSQRYSIAEDRGCYLICVVSLEKGRAWSVWL